ncbi:unnamed protein product, partial [Brassica rapa subsp. trilocularis]
RNKKLPYIHERFQRLREQKELRILWRLPVMVASTVEALSPEDGERVPFTRDKHYAMHGEILMMVLVVSFAVFLLFLVLLPCLKRRYTHHSDLSEEDASWSGRVKPSPVPVVVVIKLEDSVLEE